MPPCVKDAKLNLAQSLAGCAAQQPGRLGGIIAAQCSPDVQGAGPYTPSQFELDLTVCA